MELVVLKEHARSDSYGTYKPGERYFEHPIRAKFLVDKGFCKVYEIAKKVQPTKVKEAPKPAPKPAAKRKGRPSKKKQNENGSKGS